MGKYIVKHGQNIYDVALHIYGSIDGIIDLMVNNEQLSLSDLVVQGQELIYTDDFLINSDVSAYNTANKIVPANSIRSVYYKEVPANYHLIFELWCQGSERGITLNFTALPSRPQELMIDWGDNSQLEKLLVANVSGISHQMNNQIHPDEKRVIRIYTTSDVLELQKIQIPSIIRDVFLLYKSPYLHTIQINNGRSNITWIGAVKADVINIVDSKIADLSPLLLVDGLQELDLSGTDIKEEELDSFLINLTRHAPETSKTVKLTSAPSGIYQEPKRDENEKYIYSTGMEAVWVLTHEPEWNLFNQWTFNINNTIYTYEQNR